MSDLIDRQAAIDALDRIFDRCEEIEAHLPEGDPDRTGYKMYPDYMTVWKYLHQLSSAQPERKSKKCVWCDSPYRIEYYWIDKEGYTASFQDEERHIVATGIANFCPNCGARMEESEKDA